MRIEITQGDSLAAFEIADLHAQHLAELFDVPVDDEAIVREIRRRVRSMVTRDLVSAWLRAALIG